MINSLPSPCPILQKGQAIGSSKNVGFVAMWNWIVDFFQHIKKYITVGVNNRTGKVYIVAGKGIDINTSGDKITISIGSGNTDDDSEESSENGSGGGDGDWYPPEPVEDGEITFGGGGGMFAWTSSTKTIGVGGCMVARRWYTCTTGTGDDKADGLYQLRVTISNAGGVSLAVVSDATLGQAPTTTQSWIPIYQITNGEIAVDYRGAFVVPAYE